MSKPLKQMILDMYRKEFDGVNDALLVDIRGIEANDNNAMRQGLAGKDIKVTVVKNALAKTAFKDTGLAHLDEMMSGPSAIAHGADSVVTVARELITWAKKLKELEIKGAVMEGTVFGPNEIDALSKYPTRDEAQAQVIQVVLGPAGQVIGAATSAGSNIASILKAIEEKLENGEAITKVA
jgi:large subunit ribosomal protein L10